MGNAELARRWRRAVRSSAGPLYLRIVGALADDLHGRFIHPGDPLPSQRELAKHLLVDFTTVTRAYAEAKRRGLIATRPGLGTFVTGIRYGISSSTSHPPVTLDLSSVWPPLLDIPALLNERTEVMLRRRPGLTFSNQITGNDPIDVEAGVHWLQPLFRTPLAGRLSMACGARTAVLVLVSHLAGSGGVVLAEELTWPTVRLMARTLGVKLQGVKIDSEGLDPEDLDVVSKRSGARVLYCVPTIQNPTCAVMSVRRRKEISNIARRRGITIVEDDIFGMLKNPPVPPIASLAPDVAIYISGLSKSISPSLRVAYLLCRTARESDRINDLLRALALFAAPLQASLATDLIRSGMVARIAAAIRNDAQIRQRAVSETLAKHGIRNQPESLFFWLPLSAEWPRVQFMQKLREAGLQVAPSDAFSISNDAHHNAVRVASSVISLPQLQTVLSTIDEILSGSPALVAGLV